MEMAPNNSSFNQITSHNLNLANAPAKIILPKELVSGMQNAWDKSFPKGKSQEQGGILVRHKDGSYEWKAGQGGQSESYRINYKDVGQNETLVMTDTPTLMIKMKEDIPMFLSVRQTLPISFIVQNLQELFSLVRHFLLWSAPQSVMSY